MIFPKETDIGVEVNTKDEGMEDEAITESLS